MAHEGFFTHPKEDGTEEIVPMFIEPDSIWYTDNQSADGSQLDVLSIHSSPDSKARIYITHFLVKDLKVDDDGYADIPMDPIPDTARLLGEVSPHSPVIRLLLGGGDSLQKFVLRHTELPTESLEEVNPELEGSLSMN